GRADGQRARHRVEPGSRGVRSRAEPPALARGGAGTHRRTGDGALERQGGRGRTEEPLMATVEVRDVQGEVLRQRDLPAELFEAPVNVPVMHQVVAAGAAAQRAGTHSTKTRAEVSGGGRKPWKQKGTGRARHGSTRSPIWSGGGIAHGPKPRDYEMRVNRKMRPAGLRAARSDRLVSGK